MVMTKIRIILSLLLLLSGCGGGETAQSNNDKPVIPTELVSQFETPGIIPHDKLRLAKIDYRYDTPNNQVDINGYHTTSFESVKPVVDNIKQIGFTGVILLLQTPVDKNTGKVITEKPIPKDTWKLVDYIKSQGLHVWLSLQIVDSVTDVLLTPNFNKYTEQYMFNNIIEYQRTIATTAQHYNVNGIFISEGNYNLESYEHLFYWQQLISEVRKVYSGKLSYATYLIMPTAIWNYVDYASINMNDTLSTTPVYDLKTIISLYFGDAHGKDQIQLIKNFHMVYGKKFILTTSPTITDMGVGHVSSNFWHNVINNIWATIYTPHTDKQMQQLKIRAFVEVVNKHLIDITDGVGFGEFDPWLQHVEFNKQGTGIYHYYCCGFDLTNNKDAQKTINSYFSKQWGHYTIQ
jgi:hypothetical protein